MPAAHPGLFADDPTPSGQSVRMHVNALAPMPLKGGRRLTGMSRKLYFSLVALTQRQGVADEYSARLHQVIATIDGQTHDTGVVKRVLLELMSITVQWQSPSRDEVQTWDASNLLSGVGLTKEGRGGGVVVRWRFDPHIRTMLLSPDRYARLSLTAMANLRTGAAIALYQCCVRYVDNPSHLTARRPWREWRDILAGEIIDPNKGEYRFFKRDVLKSAIAEVNALTEIEIAGPIEHRGADNRTIVMIQFQVRPKAQTSSDWLVDAVPMHALAPADLPVVGRAVSLGIPQEQAEDHIRAQGAAALEQALDKLQRRQQMPADKVDPVNDPARWVTAVIANHPTLAPSGAAARPDSTLSSAAAEAELTRRRTRLLEIWTVRTRQRLISSLDELPQGELQDLIGRFQSHLQVNGQSSVLARLRRDGATAKSLRHPLVEPAFARFYGPLVFGPDWNAPTADDLLALALELGQPEATEQRSSDAARARRVALA